MGSLARKLFGHDAKVDVPAILAHPSTDLLSLAICGYIGGRFASLKAPRLALGVVPWSCLGVCAALVTSFGGGAYYTLLMKRPGARGQFGWKDPLNLCAVLAGYAASCALPRACNRGAPLEAWLGRACEVEAFRCFDCTNSAILIAWGTSKAFQDTFHSGSALLRLLWALLSAYTYSFGGGVTRDVVAMGIGVGDEVGNFKADVLIPAAVSIVFYHALLVMGVNALLQLGFGVPVAFCLFYQIPKILSG